MTRNHSSDLLDDQSSDLLGDQSSDLLGPRASRPPSWNANELDLNEFDLSETCDLDL